MASFPLFINFFLFFFILFYFFFFFLSVPLFINNNICQPLDSRETNSTDLQEVFPI